MTFRVQAQATPDRFRWIAQSRHGTTLGAERTRPPPPWPTAHVLWWARWCQCCQGRLQETSQSAYKLRLVPQLEIVLGYAYGCWIPTQRAIQCPPGTWPAPIEPCEAGQRSCRVFDLHNRYMYSYAPSYQYYTQSWRKSLTTLPAICLVPSMVMFLVGWL